jgi:4-aminobutyrate aminotransferase/(S)-3-amino-2-methylpropionate transaminase
LTRDRDPHSLPVLRTSIPGARSRALAQRLSRVESRNITALAPVPPIFWAEAWNASVADVDDNIYIDLTSGFGVAFAGHSNPTVAAAIAEQAARLAHGLGDVYPPDIKVGLLEQLAAITPDGLDVAILGSDGADAVEAALKTAVLRTGRPGVLAFSGAYHGLSYGALAATSRADFREPFRAQLNPHVHFAPYPAGEPDPVEGSLATALDAVRTILDDADRHGQPIGAIIVEPVQGRGGLIVPPPGFLSALRELCDGISRILIFDEVYTGVGRTGRWFACEHEGLVPDVIVVGKALTGSLPLSAAIGSAAVMSAWPASSGEAIHTSTFLGNPVACAAALAQLGEIEARGYLARATHLGERISQRSRTWVASGLAVATRGIGLLQGVRLATPDAGHAAAAGLLQRGILVLAEGDGATLAITPPACITDQQLDYALDAVEAVLTQPTMSPVN